MEDKDFILESDRNLKRWEETPRRVADDYADMNRDELIKLIIYLQERLEEADFTRNKEREESSGRISGLTSQVSALTDKITELTEQLRKNNEAMSAMAVQMAEQSRLINEKDCKISELQSTVKVGRKHLFGKKSQKGTRSRDDDNRATPHTDVEENFDARRNHCRTTLTWTWKQELPAPAANPHPLKRNAVFTVLARHTAPWMPTTACTTGATCASCPKGLS